MTIATTATLRFTSSRECSNRLAVARVAAAGRIVAERASAQARESREIEEALASSTQWVEDIRALGAVEVGCKIILAEGGKWRLFVAIEDAAAFLARQAVHEDEVEAWGRDASGEFVGTAW